MALIDKEAPKDLPPEQVKMFKEGYQLARQFFYQEQIFNALLEEMQGNPIKAIAGLVASTMLRVQSELGQFPFEIAGLLGIALIDDLMDTLEQQQVIENNPEIQGQILQEATQLWLQSNDYPPEEVAKVMQDIGAPPEAVEQIQQAPKEAPQEGMM